MLPALRWFVAAVALAGSAGAAPRQGADDPAVRAAVEQFFAVQQAEDVAAYLALWSARAERPQAESLKYIFETGDDVFSEVTVTRVTPLGDELRVRVSALRRRTARDRRPDGAAIIFTSSISTSLTFVREAGVLKLVREGPPADDLAGALIDATTPDARERLLALEPDLVNEALLLALSRRGDTAAQKSRLAVAEVAYGRALDVARRLGNRKAEGLALQNLANAKYFRRDFAGALQMYEERLTIERDAANDEGIVGSLLGIATVRYASFEYSAALAMYTEALPIQLRLQDEPGAASTLVTSGNVRYLQGDFEGAIADYRRSRVIWRTLESHAGEAHALEGLGRALSAQGDYAAALEAFAGVLADGRTRADRTAQGKAQQSIGEIHFRLGNLDVARGLFEESRGHFDAVKDTANVGRLWQALGFTDLVATRFAAAVQAYRKSAEACGLAQDRECAARAVVGLAFAQASEGHYDEAVVTYGQAITAFTSLKRLEDAARAEVGLAQAQRGRKDHEAALAAAGRARQYASGVGKDDVLWRAAVEESRALRRMTSPGRAIDAARDAVAAVERMAGAALARPGDSVPRDSVAAFALLAVLQAETGAAAAALTTIEARRVLGMRAVLARNEREIAAGMTPEERDGERASAANLVSLHLKLDHERALPKPDAARLADLQRLVLDRTAARRQEQQQLFARLPDLPLRRGLLPAGTAADLAGLLTTEGPLFVELVIDDDDVLAVTATRRGGEIDLRASIAPIARQSLAARIAASLDASVLQSPDAWRRASLDLASVLPAGVLDQIAAAPLAIVVPDDVLWRVPFEALAVNGRSVADRTAIQYAGSLTALLTGTPAAPVAPATTQMLALGAPVLAVSLRERVAATVPGWVLRASEPAALEVAGLAGDAQDPPAVVLTGEGATEEAFRTRAPGAAVIHLAAPFRMNTASPLFSPVLLAGESVGPPADPSADGVLEAREIMNMRLTARVAVLSDGAATSSRDVGSVETVQWAWQAGGVSVLVLSRWAGDEAAGRALLAAFAARLRAGDAPEAALQTARATVRAQDATSAPYYWAGWMMVGR